MKNLKNILQGISVVKLIGVIDIEITELCFDSRKAVNGCVFFANRGTQSDGHQFIPMAIGKGAISVVCELLPENLQRDITYILVKDATIALGEMASAFYDHPSSKLKLVGVTGTNGKTTTATLLYQMFTKLENKCGLLSTVIYYVGEKLVEASHTTPDALQINLLLSQMVLDGCSYCFMEVSSHSIVQHRIAGLEFSGGVFSNITHDHLDFHKTFEAYIRAKQGFFNILPNSAFALTNVDDKNGLIITQNTKAILKTYSLKSMADFHCKILESHFDGSKLLIDDTEVWTHFIGEFNAYNLLAVYGTTILLGVEKETALRILSTLIPVAGRFENFHSSTGITGIVDYAHTPDALENVLKAINQLKKSNQTLITVVGAGGDRDRTKRPKMAKIAVGLSNKVILTSDNPRSEDPEAIIAEMMEGLDKDDFGKVLNIPNRREAIRTACMLAQKGDIILIAGKGHENYQEIKGVKYHFDDKEILSEQFNLLSLN